MDSFPDRYCESVLKSSTVAIDFSISYLNHFNFWFIYLEAMFSTGYTIRIVKYSWFFDFFIVKCPL